jgi:hypothetical protein
MLESCAFAAVQRMAVPNQFVAEVAEQDFEPWLSEKAGLELLKPLPTIRCRISCYHSV